MVAKLVCDTLVASGGTPNNLTFDASGNVTVGNNLTVSGTTTQTGATTFTGAATFSSNITMSGTGARFLADFSNATVTNRPSFQTSTTNGSTGIYALPNGSSTAASWQATNNADPTNASKILIATNASTDVQLVSGINGTGTYLPLSFYTSGVANARLDTYGSLLLGTAISGTAPTTTTGLGTISTSGTLVMGSSFKRNRIINGNMAVDQRNAGASVTQSTTNVYTVDRWFCYGTVASKFTVQQTPSTTETGYATRLAAGFTNYLAITSSSSYSVGASDLFQIAQRIEGLNTADLAWGTSGAKSVTVSFWVYSSLTGTFGGSLGNGSNNRSYAFSYSIPVANTWTYISIPIAGDTAGTWTTNNTTSIYISYGLGAGSTYSGATGSWGATNYQTATGAVSVVGTNAATWYVTGVQLEVGSVATPYERQIYSDQLAQCQRYLPYFNIQAANFAVGTAFLTTLGFASLQYPVPVRTAPSGIVTSGNTDFNFGGVVTTNVSLNTGGQTSGVVGFTIGSASLTVGSSYLAGGRSGTSYIYFTGCEL